MKIDRSKLHYDVKKGTDTIRRCIQDYILKKKGVVTFFELDNHTGLSHVSSDLMGNLISDMEEIGLITSVEDGKITGDFKKLTEIKEQNKTSLPLNYNKPWSERDICTTCMLSLEGKTVVFIAKKLKRTERAVDMKKTELRNAGRLFPMMERHQCIRDFVNIHVSPNPER